MHVLDDRPAPSDNGSDSDTTRATTWRRLRPAGVSPGSLAFVAAWIVGLAIARLTGAAAVVLLLVAALVAMFGGFVAGRWRLRSVDITGITAPTAGTTGDDVTLLIHHSPLPRRSAPVQVEVLDAMVTLHERGPTPVNVTLASPGEVDRVDIVMRSAGSPGLVWWQRRGAIGIDTIHVAPTPDGPVATVDHSADTDPGIDTSGNGPRTGDLDGTRPWRPGEGQQSIHWASSLRSGEFIAHERTAASDTRWELDVDIDAARLRFTMEEGLRHGHRVALRIGADEVVDIHDHDDVMTWSAIAAQRQRDEHPADQRVPVWRRAIPRLGVAEDDNIVSVRRRILTAVTAWISLQMLLGALNETVAMRGIITIGVAIATVVSIRACAGRRPLWVRIGVALLAVGALARIAIQSSGVTALVEALRGPMPDLLLLLVVLHGAEISDRRTARVHLAITAVVTAYATGLRIDGNVAWWMLGWGFAIIATCSTRDVDPADDRRLREPSTALSLHRLRPIIGWAIAGLAATIGLATLVPVPDGPANLGLPALSPPAAVTNDTGALLGPDGSPAAPTPPSTDGSPPPRGAIGETTGYPGFSQTLDTSVRGNLGDEIVMRVRAPEPAFWRGQVFTEFDGRVWTVTPEAGRQVSGPRVNVLATPGDMPASGTPTDQFIQTYTAETDLPNVIFGAGRVETVLFDGSVTTRTDGAIRADRNLAKGTIYSVVSQRVNVTAESLRAQGDLGDRFGEFASSRNISRFLTIPDSTSQRTLDLAADLRVEGSTYDTIIKYQNWLALNTEYDLNAPVPDGDAVDDFLFGSQRGFCEQIASSLVVMLRSQGVPARLATGYIPGERDRISGVFAVRASDAHAWVEVWFPETGWEAFDPTAEVPLAGDAQRTTVGADAATALISGVLSKPLETAGAIGLIAGMLAAIRWVTEQRRRRERGPWGLLHDRFMALSPEAVTAPDAASRLAERWARHNADNTTLSNTALSNTAAPQLLADEVASMLDRAAFDPSYESTAQDRKRVASSITTLERSLPDT
ncbi:MAG: transglutaminaseTgpA domain-containing protein [Ilumatobacter sp.]